MKSPKSWLLSGLDRAWCLGLLLGLSTAAQPADEAPAVPAAPAPPEVQEATPPAPEERAPSRRRPRAQEIVAVGDDANLKAGQVANEVVVVHGDASIEGDVNGDVVVVLGRLRVTGKVDGDVVVVLGEAEIDGPIRGDLTMVLTGSRLGPNAEVDGDLQAVGVPPDIDPAAKLARQPEIISLGPLTRYFAGLRDYFFEGVLLLRPLPPGVGWVWMAAGLFLALHLFLALILATPMKACMSTVRDQPARSFLIGLLACILIGPVSILLSFTVVAPLLLWLAFFAACVFGRVSVYAAAGAAVGRTVNASSLEHPIAAVLVGSVLFYLGYMIPVLGLFLYGLVVPLGVGAVLIRIFDAMRRERGPLPAAMPPGRMGSGGGVLAASALTSGTPGPTTQAFAESTVPPVASASSATEPGVGTAPPVMTGAAAGTGPVGAEVPRHTLSGIEAVAQPRVGFWPRLGATLIDWVLIGVINAMTFETVKTFWLLLAVYHVVMWGWRATTLGGAIFNLRIVRLDGRPFDWPTSIVRLLGAVVSLVPLGLGFFWASWDPECQSWHDRIAGTTIVKPERRLSLI